MEVMIILKKTTLFTIKIAILVVRFSYQLILTAPSGIIVYPTPIKFHSSLRAPIVQALSLRSQME